MEIPQKIDAVAGVKKTWAPRLAQLKNLCERHPDRPLDDLISQAFRGSGNPYPCLAPPEARQAGYEGRLERPVALATLLEREW